MKKIKINSENILYFTIGILCLGGFFYSLIYTSFSEPENIKNACKSVASLYKKSKAAKGYNAIYIYNVSGIKYEYSTTYEDINYIGQNYNIIYDKTNPTNARLIFEEPMFMKDEVTVKTTATVIKLQTEIFSKKAILVVFNYMVGSIKYNTYQYSDWDKYNVKVGDKCELEYLEDNPAICIIHLDKKMK
jgi:hypothetical protein